jgi:hypothetical protein
LADLAELQYMTEAAYSFTLQPNKSKTTVKDDGIGRTDSEVITDPIEKLRSAASKPSSSELDRLREENKRLKKTLETKFKNELQDEEDGDGDDD